MAETPPTTGMLGSMSGAWILDKSRGQPSMRGYLETMGVTELAIEAHEKGETEHDTIHIIKFDDGEHFEIQKMSRVTDMTMKLKLGEEFHQSLPGNRTKTVLASSDCPGQNVKILSQMPTMNGVATVLDSKTLKRESSPGNPGSTILVLEQSLTIRNELSGKEHTTVRYFIPHQGEIGAPAATAKGSDEVKVAGSGGQEEEAEEEDEEDYV